MKLAEALMLRADMRKSIESLRERIARNVLLQEGDTPTEEPEQLIEQINTAIEEFQRLATRINRANQRSPLGDGRTLSDALAHRDALVAQHAVCTHAIEHCQRDSRYSAREIKWVSHLSVAELYARANQVSRQIRELNARIQEANWRTEID